jgi:hypothetical protein
MDVAAGGIPWEHVEKVLGRMNSEKKAAAKRMEGEPPAFPIRGTLRLSIGSFKFRDFSWKPVLVDIELAEESITATVRKADICGISTTGKLQFLRGGAMSVTARVASVGPDIDALLTCLRVENAQMTGRYEASLEVEGKGKPAELDRALQGPVTFRASQGTMGKASLVMKVLSVVNVTSVFGGGKSRVRLGEAMPFDEFTVDGQVEDGRVSIRNATLKSPSFTMTGSGSLGYLDESVDLMVLARPFSTMDRILRMIPVLRYILGRDFLSVAAKVTGNLDDPKIRLAPAREVGQWLVDALARTVKLPVHVVDPSSP